MGANSSSPASRRGGLLAGRLGTILLPAAIFQIVLVGPGFSTGREVVEFAGQYGALGLMSAAVILVGFAILCVIAYELARVMRAYNYREFIRHIVGPAWPLFDALWVIFTLVIIGLVTAAVGEVLFDTFGIPALLATVVVLVVVGVVILLGRSMIEGFDLVGSILFSSGITLFAVVILSQRWDDVVRVLAEGDTSAAADAGPLDAIWAGALYVAYNIPTMVPVLFCLDRQTRRSESVASGVLSAFLVVVPFTLTYLAILAFYRDGIVAAPIPWLQMFEAVGGTVLAGLFAIVLTYAVIDTGTSMVHAFLDRIDGALDEAGREHLPWRRRAIVVVLFLGAAFGLSQVGVIGLVAQGYTLLAYGFLLVFVVPLVTRGVYLIATRGGRMSVPLSVAAAVPAAERRDPAG